jgi:serine/threonine-protein kinase
LQRLFEADHPAHAVCKVLSAPIAPPSTKNPNVSPALDRVALKALDRDVDQRFQTASEFAEAIEEAIRLSTARRVGEWVVYLGGEDLALNSGRLAAIESSSLDVHSPGGQKAQDQQTAQATQPVRKRPETYSDVEAISTAILAEADVTPAPTAEKTARLLRSRLVLRWLSSRRHRGPILAGVFALALAIVVVGIVRLPAWDRAQATLKAKSAVPIPGTPVSSAFHELTDLPRPDLATVVAAPVESTKRTTTSPSKASPKSAATQLSTTRLTTKRKGCKPPFFVDGQGIRRVKPECL